LAASSSPTTPVLALALSSDFSTSSISVVFCQMFNSGSGKGPDLVFAHSGGINTVIVAYFRPPISHQSATVEAVDIDLESVGNSETIRK
jgi:hypothetical protein